PVAQHGRGEDAPEAVRASEVDERRRRIGIKLDISDIQQSRRRHHAAGKGAALRGRREDVPQRLQVDAFGAVEGGEVDERAVVTEHEADYAIALPESAGRDAIDYRLPIRTLARYAAQNL